MVPFDLDDTDERRATPLSSLKLGPIHDHRRRGTNNATGYMTNQTT
jgi:hypothetical protein